MKTREEVEEALRLLVAYRTNRLRPMPDVRTRDNLLGVEAALDWVLGQGEAGPIPDTLRDIRKSGVAG